MTTLHTLQHRMERLGTLVEQQQDVQNNALALELLTRSLCVSLASVSEDGSQPADFDQQEQQLEQRYTAQERAILDRFARRYPCEQVKQELLHALEQQIRKEEGQSAA